MTAIASDPLEAAARIGDRIASTAVWHRGRCNWVGRTLEGYAALDGDLYAGTAGVALFLAEASAALGDPELERVARGAIGHALAHPGTEHGGLYLGPLSVALAASRILGDDPRVARTVAAWRKLPPGDVPDLLAGWAGAICALLALSADVDTARRLGERLLAAAERTRDGWSWKAPQKRAEINLCNLAHGTAGIGLALLELFAATGDERFREAAEGAFDYERTWWRRAGGRWPDLRGVGRGVPPDAPFPATRAWCHGAPGGLLARLRCAELAPGPYQAEAEAALAETRAIAAHPGTDPCLCHGTAGIADALLRAGDDPSPLVPAIRTTDATPPGLMLGLAGIGLFHLRRADPTIPTPLLVHSLDPIGQET